jgi:radical SAM superfamily enzyme
MTEEQTIEATLAVLRVLPSEIVIHRLSSDPHPEELVEPRWMLDRAGVRRRLEQAMERENFRQGSAYSRAGSAK